MLRKSKFNILVTGVGGQGILTLSRLLAESALESNYNVIVSEIHGLAQRGGSVAVHVRISSDQEPLAPLIPKGGADIMVALEIHEALRYLDYLSRNGIIVMNLRVIPPTVPGVRTFKIDEAQKILSELNVKYYGINADELALEMGKPYVANVIVLGFLAGLNVLPMNRESYISAIRKVFSEKVIPENINAFELGYSLAVKNIQERP